HQQPTPEPELCETYRLQAESLAKGIIPAELENISATPVTTPSDDAPSEIKAEETEAAAETDNYAAELTQAYALANTPTEAASDLPSDLEIADVDGDGDGDGQLWDIFGAEAVSHLETLKDYVTRMEAQAPMYEPPSEDMQRALHT